MVVSLIRLLNMKLHTFSCFFSDKIIPATQNIAEGAEGAEGRRRKKRRFDAQRAAEAIMRESTGADGGGDDADDRDGDGEGGAADADKDAGAVVHSRAPKERSIFDVRHHELMLLLPPPPPMPRVSTTRMTLLSLSYCACSIAVNLITNEYGEFNVACVVMLRMSWSS
jgi:hypothetical protein